MNLINNEAALIRVRIAISFGLAVHRALMERIMARSVTSPRHDLAARREALSLACPEIVRRLTEIAGRKLTAYIAGVKDARVLDRWINGTEPHGNVEERLRFTYQVVRTLSQHDSPRIVQAWLTGVNPELGDRVPLPLPAAANINFELSYWKTGFLGNLSIPMSRTRSNSERETFQVVQRMAV